MNGTTSVNLTCDTCGAGFYSAAAHVLAAGGERCDECGGALQASAVAALQPLALAA